MTNHRYSVILADPPWSYRNRGTRASADKHYPTMTLKEIMALPVGDLAAMPCALFLWATWPNIFLAEQVFNAWGFEYKALAWSWVKLTKAGKYAIGLGNYSRSNPEPCLLAFKKVVTRGRIVRPEDRSISAVLPALRGKHSRKPDEQYDRIERMYPDVPKLELFARQTRPGWACWGNDIEGGIAWP